ncbi:hypothetical protein Q7P36_005756 [Cladosporium allicinum]
MRPTNLPLGRWTIPYKLCAIVVYKKPNTRRITHVHRSITQRDSSRELAGPHHSYTCKLYVGVSGTRHHRHRRMHRKGVDNAPAIPGAGQQIMVHHLHEAIHSVVLARFMNAGRAAIARASILVTCIQPQTSAQRAWMDHLKLGHRSQSISLLLAIDIIRLNADDLATTDERIELRAIPQLVPHTLPASSGSSPEANLVALQPGLAGLLVFDALVNGRAEVFEHAAAVAAETDILAATDVAFGTATQPVCSLCVDSTSRFRHCCKEQ